MRIMVRRVMSSRRSFSLLWMKLLMLIRYRRRPRRTEVAEDGFGRADLRLGRRHRSRTMPVAATSVHRLGGVRNSLNLALRWSAERRR